MNGNLSQEAASAASSGMKKSAGMNDDKSTSLHHSNHLANGIQYTQTNGEPYSSGPYSPLQVSDLPLEVRQGFEGAFMPLGKLIGRTVQDAWKNLYEMVDQLPPLPQRTQASDSGYLPNGATTNGQSKINLDKKDRLLNFAADQKAIFIKLLVMLQWSKDAEDVSKALQIRFWLHDQRQIYFNVTHQIGLMKRQLASFQVPNPDLRTAANVLSLQRVPGLPTLDYIQQKPLTPRRILRTLKSLNHILCSRLSLGEELPHDLRNYKIHDGRVTFSVPFEFELDLTVMEPGLTSNFHFLNFRFLFSPSSAIPEGPLFDDMAAKVNSILQRDGLLACYEFLHDMVLSFKLNILHKQAIELLRGQFANNLRVEMIRRTLVVQYWITRSAPKSWIEIGIKKGQREDSLSKPILDIKWMREHEEVKDHEIILDPAVLSLDDVLRQVFASHISHMIDLIYDEMIILPPYASGELLLEQFSTFTEPSECQLTLQLTKSKQTTLTMEPVGGSLILSPATSFTNRVEQSLRQSRNLAVDTPHRLTQLRCNVAEADLINIAETTGWDIVRNFKPTQLEMKSLFTDHVISVLFLRRSFWEKEHMVAATFSSHGDHWWLLRGVTDTGTETLWKSQQIGSRPMHEEENLSYEYLARLAHYVSGMITMQTNANYLASVAARFVLPDMPRLARSYSFPKLSMDFQPARLQTVLSYEAVTTDFGLSSLNMSSANLSSNAPFIRRTINITFSGFENKANMVVVLARGRFSASRKVLRRLADSALNPLLHINPSSRRFSIRLFSPVGKPVVGELFQQLLHLENIIACLSMAQEHGTLEVVSLSTSHLSLKYHESEDGDLGFVIHFGSPSLPTHLELWPRKSNPHMCIATQLNDVLIDQRRSLPSNLKILIPLLSYTLPLLSCLQELQSAPQNSINSDVQPRLHIMPRHATMYGIQYFVPANMDPTMPANAEGSSRMLARFEILPSQRAKQCCWILRPAIEEFETYNRLSFATPDLKMRLETEIFARIDDGWLALDAGAACPIDKPQKLLQALHDVVAQWLMVGSHTKEAHVARSGAVQQAIAPTAKQQPTIQAPARIQPQPRITTNGNVHARTKQAALPSKGSSLKKGQDIIQID